MRSSPSSIPAKRRIASLSYSRTSERAELVLSRAASTDALSRAGFRAEQTGGSGFGSMIRPARGGETAGIDAFAVPAPAEGASRLRLSAADGTFAREIVAVGARNGLLALLLALVPLLAFLLGRSAASRRREAS
jgi:hypothetical protein